MRTVVLSCGVLLLSERRELFLAHATGARHWDIPKGLADRGETPEQAARRETREEAAIDLEGVALHDLGRHRYRPGKDLHLYAAMLVRDSVDLASCRCSTYFVDPVTRRRVPEADAYAWVPLDALAQRCAKSLVHLFATEVDLAALCEQLRPVCLVDGTRRRFK